MCCRGVVRLQGVTRRSCVATGSVELAAGGRGRRRGPWPSSRARSSSVGCRSSPSPPSDHSAARFVAKPSRRRSSASSRGSATSIVFLILSSTPSSTRTFDALSVASCDSTLAPTPRRRATVEAESEALAAVVPGR